MTGFRLIAPPPDRGPLLTFVVTIVAALIGAVILVNFIDALNMSIARGEAMRAAHRVVPPTHFNADKPVLMAQAPQRSVNR